MMRFAGNWLCGSALALALGISAGSTASAQSVAATERPASAATSQRATTSTGAHVYLFRGLMNIFSLGMDELAAKIQARGIPATVYNHAEWQTVADEIAARYKARRHGPIILVGHSLGADAVMFMGEYLGKKGVPVALAVPFDGTGSFAASSNVARVMNFTQRDYAHMRRGPGFRGELSNIDVSGQPGIDHVNIDKSARLHAMALNKIQSVAGRGGAPRSRPASVASPSSQAPKPSPETTASTSASEAKPANAPTESSANRAPARSE